MAPVAQQQLAPGQNFPQRCQQVGHVLGIGHAHLDAGDGVRLLEEHLRGAQRQEHHAGVVLFQSCIEDRHHLVGLHARDGAERRRGTLRRDHGQWVTDTQPIQLGQPDADGDRVVAGEPVQAAGDDVVADRRQRPQIVQRHAAHQPALRAAVRRGQQRLAIQHAERGDDARHGADLRQQRRVAVDRLAGVGLDLDVPVHPQDATLQLDLEPAHHAGHHDQRGDAQRDADQREDRDDGDEALALAGTQVAPGDRALERTEHCHASPPPLEGGGWGEGSVPHEPLPPAPSLKGRGSSSSARNIASRTTLRRRSGPARPPG